MLLSLLNRLILWLLGMVFNWIEAFSVADLSPESPSASVSSSSTFELFWLRLKSLVVALELFRLCAEPPSSFTFLSESVENLVLFSAFVEVFVELVPLPLMARKCSSLRLGDLAAQLIKFTTTNKSMYLNKWHFYLIQCHCQSCCLQIRNKMFRISKVILKRNIRILIYVSSRYKFY